MKTIKNKTTTITGVTGDQKADYKELIGFCLNNPPQGGFDFQEMNNRFRIENALEKSNGDIKLEDTDAENLKSIVGSMKWAVRHKDIMDFIETVNKL